MAPAQKIVKVIMVMADYGFDPTESAIPYSVFTQAGFQVDFATETGNVPRADTRMIQGLTQKFLGADQNAIKQYTLMTRSPAFQKPLSWTSPTFSMESYDLLFLPGGHDKANRQMIDSKPLQRHVASFFPQSLRAQEKETKKTVSAICHGVQALSWARYDDGKSVLHDATTTALPSWLEQSAYYGTWLFLGDYYKTYGHCSESVQTFVTKELDHPSQFKNSYNPLPFVVEDDKYAYLSARWPIDAQLLAERTVLTVKKNLGMSDE